jgi:excisionase family DNA binding protein
MSDASTNDTSDAPLLYTADQAAALLQISPSWLRKKATARAIPCTFIGKHLRFSTNDLALIITAGAHTPATSNVSDQPSPAPPGLTSNDMGSVHGGPAPRAGPDHNPNTRRNSYGLGRKAWRPVAGALP